MQTIADRREASFAPSTDVGAIFIYNETDSAHGRAVGTPRISSALSNLPASSSSSNDFEIGSSHEMAAMFEFDGKIESDETLDEATRLRLGAPTVEVSGNKVFIESAPFEHVIN